MLKFKKSAYITTSTKKVDVPEGVWIKCDACREALYREDVAANRFVCYKCGKYFRISAKRRIRMVADPESFKEWDTGIETPDPLRHPGYTERIEALREKLRTDEAAVTGKCTIHGEKTVLAVLDARFFMGSMGYTVGEKITRAVERATKEGLPIVIFTCSGGARMQEGMVSLMQMAKTSAALRRHSEAGLFYLTVLTDPTTGGVTASFAMLGDIILAEPGALVGFAGSRVIEQTIKEKLPKGFQRSEFLLEHGIIDGIITRDTMRETIAGYLRIHGKRAEPSLIKSGSAGNAETADNKKGGKDANSHSKRKVGAWDRVMRARSADRLTALDYIEEIFSGFEELHGDRHGADDKATVGGIAYLDECPVTVIGQQKGRNTKENIKRNFGMPSPEGYRKALRLMMQAEKFGRPIINFIDTPGAYPGREAEEHGQGEAIAKNLSAMSSLKVPVLAIVIGEGGSGGALALAVANEVWMLENATYSILSPEGFASILWKDAKRAPEAAGMMRMTADELREMGIIERVIREEKIAVRENRAQICDDLRDEIRGFLLRYLGRDAESFTAERYERFRAF